MMQKTTVVKETKNAVWKWLISRVASGVAKKSTKEGTKKILASWGFFGKLIMDIKKPEIDTESRASQI